MGLKKKLSSFVLGAVCVSAFATSAAAAVVDVGGGKWDHDYSNGVVHSYYLHNSKVHSAAVKVGGQTYSSGWIGEGTWAKASATYSWYDSISTYYNLQ
ncbi:lactococcin 972 family bacteriocin [Bacillus sp. JKS001846]|uniref:lactococcin 972 family bacteriocin n=1 Tax=Bacillus sp. JKS001846 TaxID=1938743 RepID=UPI0009D8FA62|nr:lactococcin 972 family bacteriocin [Bacillus sp. JKS001846]SMD41364.1 bacteriocin, lactococcin 972 family [Bacillus sp. JKS001846]